MLSKLNRLWFWKQNKALSNEQLVNNKRGRARKLFSKLSAAFMLPISVMSIAGLFLGIGAAIESNATADGVRLFGQFIKSIGDPIFGAMPVLFLIAIIVSFTDDVGTAVFAGVASFLVFNAVQTPFISRTGTDQTGSAVFLNINISNEFAKLSYKTVGSVMGITALNTSIFAGIVVGLIIARLYKKFHTIKLPAAISFFGGKRFVSLIGILVMVPLAFLFLLLWPFVGYVLGLIGENLGKVAGLDSFVFGFIERALVPTGLHHVFYAPLWWTAAGGDVSETIQNSGAVITAINEGAISVNSSNWATIQSLIESLGKLQLRNVSTGVLSNIFANPAAISATYAGLGAAAPSAADITNIFNEINAVTASQLTRAVGSDVIAAPEVLSALLAARNIRPVTSLNDLLVSTIGTNDVGDSFGWLSVQASSVNTVAWNMLNADGTVASQHSAPIFQFLDQMGLRLGRFMQGKFTFMQFGLPAAAAAMVMAAPKERRKEALSLIFPAALTSFITGVTEPIEFTFLFLAPWLYFGFHALMAAFGFLFMNLAHAHIGMTFSGGFIDLIVYGIIPVQKGTQFWWGPVIGVGYAPIYYFVFYWAIKRFDLETPGRAAGLKLYSKADWRQRLDKARNKNVAVNVSASPAAANASAETAVASKATAKANKNALTPQSAAIVKGFGGWDNIVSYTNCATRLRYDVKDEAKVDLAALKQVRGVAGAIKAGRNHFQVIMGTVVDQVNENIKQNINAPLD